ncbi:MAG: hypothetical protein SOW80_07965 [Anaerovoracaceae bacterium]|nr:hypothetical protein [Anaerovoracaceae bacterium]
MEKERSAAIVEDSNGNKVVIIKDIRFKGRKKEDWKVIEEYLKQYVGEFYEIVESSEIIYISSDFPDYVNGYSEKNANIL